LKLLIIEDDLTLNSLLAAYLGKRGYDILSAMDGEEALRLAEEGQPDLVILDIMMPGTDGWETCRRLRQTSQVPVLILTAKVSQDDVLRGLQLGADDYVKKPFDLRELELRIQAILRRAGAPQAGPAASYDDGRLHVDMERRLVLLDHQPVHLTPTEFRLLSYLVQHRGRAVPHMELLCEVWGPEYADDTAILSVYIRYLREKLEDKPGQPRYIRTEWGVGYRFVGLSGGSQAIIS
jgi:two-component system KDP operon response regulator KdpE